MGKKSKKGKIIKTTEEWAFEDKAHEIWGTYNSLSELQQRAALDDLHRRWRRWDVVNQESQPSTLAVGRETRFVHQDSPHRKTRGQWELLVP